MDYLISFVEDLFLSLYNFFFVNPQYGIITYIGCFITAGFIYALKRKGKPVRFRAILKYAFPKKLLLHPSTYLDIKIYIFVLIWMLIQVQIVFGIQYFISNSLVDLYLFILNRDEPFGVSMNLGYQILIPLVLLMAIELGYWLAHYIMHKNPYMWEFHKLHHNAEVLTPLTEIRQHPVDLLCFAIVMGVVYSAVVQVIVVVFGEGAQLLPYWSTNTFIFVYFITLGHLRHSHVKLSTTGIWSYILNSPSHHHIHHSTDPKHYDKNMGYMFLFWDWIFGTLHRPEEDKDDLEISFGTGDDMDKNYSLIDQVAVPFREVFFLLVRKKKPFQKILKNKNR